MEGKIKTRGDSLKSQQGMQTQPQTRRQYNYLSDADRKQSATVSPYRKLLSPRENSTRQSKEKQVVPQRVVPFIGSETVVNQNKPVQNNPLPLKQQTSAQQHALNPNTMIQQMQRLKMQLIYLQGKVRELKVQNEQLLRQKRRINQSYIVMLNESMCESEGYVRQVSELKRRQGQQLSYYISQMRRMGQQKEMHDAQINKMRLANKSLKQQVSQLKLLQSISDQQYRQSMLKLAQQQRQCKKHCIYLQQKLKSYQELLFKKEFQLQEVQTKYDLLEKQNYFHQMDEQKARGLVEAKAGQIQMLKEENSRLNQKINQLQSHCKYLQTNTKALEQNKRHMTQQIGTLLEIDQHKDQVMCQQKHTMDTLAKQMHALKAINDQLLAKLQSTQLKNNQQQHMLNRQVQGLKQRQRVLMQNERSLKDYYNSTVDKKSMQVEQLLRENQRLYKELNKLKFNPK